MALRQIIEIDEAKCTGCGLCAEGCPEGALRIIEGKARLVGENLCDGLGACIGTCPEGAILITEREAEAYDEAKVMEGMAKQGDEVLKAHLEHLARHGQDRYVKEALAWMEERGLSPPVSHETCPGSMARRFTPLRTAPTADPSDSAASSALGSWPIQLHLVNPRAPQFANADLLIAADCTAFSLGGFHDAILAGRSLVIACPKLDEGREIYRDKLTTMINTARSVTVAIMEVPCCSGLHKLALEAREAADQRPEIRTIVLGIGGGVVRESKA